MEEVVEEDESLRVSSLGDIVLSSVVSLPIFSTSRLQEHDQVCIVIYHLTLKCPRRLRPELVIEITTVIYSKLAVQC